MLNVLVKYTYLSNSISNDLDIDIDLEKHNNSHLMPQVETAYISDICT